MRVEAINGGEREPAKAKKPVKNTRNLRIAQKVAAKKPAAKRASAPATHKAPKKGAGKAKATPAPVGFIDKALMEKAIELRGQGKTMKEIGVLVNVKATAYLAKKIKDTFGADALDRPRREA
jgi:hypothetical protein